MAAGDRRAILHFDWTLFVLVLAQKKKEK